MSRSSPRRQPSPRSTVSLWPVAASLLVVAAALAALVLHLRGGSAAPAPAPTGFFGTHYPSQGHQGHMPGDDVRFAHFRYSSDPPTSGYHREVLAPALINDRPLPRYVQVHLLEHGNILLQYGCLCPQIARQLAEIADQYNAKLFPGVTSPTEAQMQAAQENGLAVIVAPYPGMAHTIALTAWTRLATLDQVDAAKIDSFINQWLHNQDNLNQ
jgi:hypothetical protein